VTTFFVDTSALAKRYLAEIGSTWTRSWVEPAAGNVVVISDLTSVEMFSLFTRRLREGTITAPAMTSLQTDFLAHFKREYLAVGIDENVLTLARGLVVKYVLRPPDAIQLASAIYAMNWLNETMIFVCADQNLLIAAAGEGFTTDNPNAHP
jgi:uncharacterized protein